CECFPRSTKDQILSCITNSSWSSKGIPSTNAASPRLTDLPPVNANFCTNSGRFSSRGGANGPERSRGLLIHHKHDTPRIAQGDWSEQTAPPQEATSTRPRLRGRRDNITTFHRKP